MFRHMFALSLPFLAPDDGNPGGGGGNETPTTPPVNPEFDEAQQKFINGLLAKERKDAEERTATRLQDEATRAATEAEEKRKRDEAEARGEFEQVRGELETKVTSIESERDSLAAENAALTAYFTAQYDAAVKELPDVITAFQPAADASVATKSEWLIKAKEQAAKVAKDSGPGNGPNPKPSDGTWDEKAALARARQSGRYTA